MHIVYKTTNLVNGKYYVGVSNGNNPSYRGSGTALKRALKKYGSENFLFEIIAECSNEDEMFQLEAEIVNESFVANPNTYNMKLGGRGGKGTKKSEEHKRNIAKNRKGGKPIVDIEETMRIYLQYGLKGGAEFLGINYQAFKARVLLAKKK